LSINNLFGGLGNDRLVGHLGDVLDGGPGINRIVRSNTLPVFPGFATTSGLGTTLATTGIFTATTPALGITNMGFTAIGGLGSPIGTTQGLSTLFGGTGGALAATSPAIAFGSSIGTLGSTAATSPLLTSTFGGTISSLGTPLNSLSLASMPVGSVGGFV